MEYKVQALKLAHEIGGQRAAKELGIPKNTLYGWIQKERQGAIDLGPDSRSPDLALILSQESTALRQQVTAYALLPFLANFLSFVSAHS